jgi:hypothetical protein
MRYSRDDVNRLDRIEHVNAMETGYTYGDEGQLTCKGTTACSFDDAHRLLQRGADTFVYDGVGNWIKSICSGAQTQFIYDAAGKPKSGVWT